MSVPQPACSHCGKNFTTDDLREVACKHCGTVLAHHQRAAQQVAVVQGMLADRNGNGIPDAYEGLVAQAQMNAGAHVHAHLMGMPGASPYAQGPYPPGAPVMGAPMMGAPGMPNMYVAQANHDAGQAVAKAATISVIAIVAIVGLSVGLLVVGGVVAFLLVAR